MKKSAIVVVINSLLIYDYVGGREDVNPDPDKVRTLIILCSLVLWLQMVHLWIYNFIRSFCQNFMLSLTYIPIPCMEYME